MSAIYTYWDFEEGMFNIRGIQTRQNVQCQTGKIDDDTGWTDWIRIGESILETALQMTLPNVC